MSGNARSLLRKFILLGAACALVLIHPAIVWAQPPESMTWFESLYLDVNGIQETTLGNDDALPDPVSVGVRSPAYSIEESISFAAPGPPNVTAAVDMSNESLAGSLFGTALGEIYFEFRVVATPPSSGPPTVPVRVAISGSAWAGGDAALPASASVAFIVWDPTEEPIAYWRATATNAQGEGTGSFNESIRFEIKPALKASALMSVSAHVGREPMLPGTSAHCSASIGPPTITTPGEGYEVQVSNGYWALGPVPVQPATWGSIKSRYRM